MFTADYVGKAWHSLAALNLVAGGQGLLGLMVDPTNQNTCNVIFWQRETTLPCPINLLKPRLLRNRPAEPWGARGAAGSCTGRANRLTAESRVGRIQPLGLGAGSWSESFLPAPGRQLPDVLVRMTGHM